MSLSLLPPTCIFDTFQLISEQSIGTPVVLMVTKSLYLVFDLVNEASKRRWEAQQEKLLRHEQHAVPRDLVPIRQEKC